MVALLIVKVPALKILAPNPLPPLMPAPNDPPLPDKVPLVIVKFSITTVPAVMSNTLAKLAPLNVKPSPCMVSVFPSVTLMVMASAADAKVMLPVSVMVSSRLFVCAVRITALSPATVFTDTVCTCDSVVASPDAKTSAMPAAKGRAGKNDVYGWLQKQSM